MMRLFVGNLDWNVTDRELRDAFLPHGAVVKAEVVRDRVSGAGRGYGFVEMASEDAARDALATLNGAELRGREMRVEIANPRPQRPDAGERRRAFGARD